MDMIKIPFNAWSKKKFREERKWSTSRTKIWGTSGDIFEVEGEKYAILSVVLMPTKVIIEHMYPMEGADSPDELRKVFNSIFRGKKLPENMYFHAFIPFDKFLAEFL